VLKVKLAIANQVTLGSS